MADRQRWVLWVSTSLATRGGIATFVRQMRATALWQDWNIRHIATHRNGSTPARAVVFAIGFTRLLKALALHRPELAHIHTSSHGSFVRKCAVAWVCKGFGVPVVLHVHGSRFDEFHQRTPRVVRWVIRWTLERTDVVVALGSNWAQRLRGIAPRARIETIPNAVRPGLPVDQSPNGEVNVVFLGEIGPRKGTYVLLHAWAELMRAHPAEARLTIAGDGDVSGALGKTSELRIDDTVTVCGWLDASAVSRLLDDSHILVLPSRSEGQPMAVLEAMARGLCVVASDAGGIPELLDDAGITVPPDDAEVLADALGRVIADPDARRDMGDRALARVRAEYDIAVVSQRFDEIYRELTARGRNSG